MLPLTLLMFSCAQTGPVASSTPNSSGMERVFMATSMDVRLAGRVRRCHHSPVPLQLPEVTGKPLRDNVFPSRRHHIAAARGGRWLLLGLALALALPLPSGAQTTRETERKLQKLRTELKGVAQERRQIEGQRGQASQQLREADEKVARTGRALAQTEAALREQGRALAEAEQRRNTLQTNLAQQHRELAGLLRAAYQLGNHAPLKLLLSQDTVADANRALAYHRYLQRERAQRITTLTADLKELEAVQAQIAERKQKLQGRSRTRSSRQPPWKPIAAIAQRRWPRWTNASRTSARRNRRWARMPRHWKRCWRTCVPPRPGRSRAPRRRASSSR